MGFELGAASIAVMLTMGPLLLALAVVGAATWPELPVGPMLIVLGVAACVLPVVAYPLSYTVWQAIDLRMRPVDPIRDLDHPIVRPGDT